MRRGRSAAVLLSAGLVLTACGSTPEQPDAAPTEAPSTLDQPGGGDNPLAWDVFYENPDSTAARAVTAAVADGDEETATALQEIADQPTATWYGGGIDPFLAAQDITTAAQAVERVPLLVAYNLPERDCGQYSSGGAADVDSYLDWLGSLAAGIGDRPAVVVLEPDAVPHGIEGCAATGSSQERFAMLASAVEILKRQPNTAVYVDAGNASWIDDTRALADALRASGVAEADGFALNTSNFESTDRSVAYGTEISDQLDGAHFVIDTSRNGTGAPAGNDSGDHSTWCNPAGMRLGETPTTDTGEDRVDALLWIKQPGDSDGECGRDEPAAGAWYEEYALELVEG